MKAPVVLAAMALSLGMVSPALAISGNDATRANGGSAVNLPPYLQCVPYARQLTGIQIYGDAH
ncbi:MAG TPA: CHAP domain-containing protein, partial [Novosphingobium sp.]|nr:CHAP domain-containing protein [Novosphingobium sp.]